MVGGELLDTCEKALQLAIDMIGPIYARRTTRRKNSKITITFDLEPDEDPASTNFTITPDCKVAVPGFILNTMQASIGVQSGKPFIIESRQQSLSLEDFK